MGSQIKFFTKNIIDIGNINASIFVTDTVATNNGQTFVDYVRNRNNWSAWATTGSTDAANTQLDIYFGDSREISSIILILHNFKNYTIQYWNGISFQNFSTSISITNNTLETTSHEFTQVTTNQIRLIVTATMIANDDKFLRQLICIDKIGTGQLEAWPNIKNPTASLNKQSSKMISGKSNIIETSGYFQASLNLSYWKSANDLDMLERIFFRREGVLVWLCGGDETQFSSKRIGYRLQDIYLVRPTNEYEPEWNTSVYTNGLNIRMDLVEVTV